MSSQEFNNSLFKDIFGDLSENEQKRIACIINCINNVLEREKWQNSL